MTDLEQFFGGRGLTALAFSGGADSTYLLHEAVRLGADIVPYYVSTEFCRMGDRDFADRMCGLAGVSMRVLEVSLLDDPQIRSNTPDRCYLCKRRILSAVLMASRLDGCRCVIDGTNASDDESDRPGMRALRELGILSPLREAGMTKDMIREASREAGIPTWDMPSNSCLATRISFGTPIDRGCLARVEEAEDAVKALGFPDLRVRTDGTDARVEFRSRRGEALERRSEVMAAVEPFFNDVTIE